MKLQEARTRIIKLGTANVKMLSGQNHGLGLASPASSTFSLTPRPKPLAKVGLLKLPTCIAESYLTWGIHLIAGPACHHLPKGLPVLTTRVP